MIAADRFARARLDLEEAMARGCSIPQLKAMRAKERHDSAMQRLEARRAACGRRDATPSTDAPRYWWKDQD